MLKTIEQKLRDKERQEIIRADQESARSLQRFVKKARANDNEILQERQTMTQYAQYSLENKYLAFEKAIKQAYNMIDNNTPFDGFVNVISAYNELINYIVSIVKYNSLNQSMRVPIDERMNKLNNELINLINISNDYNLRSLNEMSQNIKNKIYKLVNIDINYKKYEEEQNEKEELNEKVTAGIQIIRETFQNLKNDKSLKVKVQPPEIVTAIAQLKKIKNNKPNLSTKRGRDIYEKDVKKVEKIKDDFMRRFAQYVPQKYLMQEDSLDESSPRRALELNADPRDLLREMQLQPSVSDIMQSMKGPIRVPNINMPESLVPKRRERPPKLLKFEQIPIEAREEKFMQDPEKVDVPASQVMAPILEPEVVQGMENAQDIFKSAFDKFKDPNYGKEESAEEKLSKGVFINEPEDALLGKETAQIKKPRGRPQKIIKDIKPYKSGEEPETAQIKKPRGRPPKTPKEPEFKEIEIEIDDNLLKFEPEPEPEPEMDPDFFEPDIGIEEQDTMNDFYNKTPLKGPLREKFIKLLAKRHRDRTGKTIEESIEYIRNGTKSGDIILDNRFSRLYLDNDPELNTIIGKISAKKEISKKEISKKQKDYNTELYDEFTKEEHKEAKRLFDTYKTFIKDDTLIELLANEFIEKNPKYSKDYDFEEKQYFAKQMINKGIKDERINLIDQVYRLKEQGNKKLLSMLKRITKL